MKKHYLLLPAALLLAGAAQAQGTELFFSEYDEGSHQSTIVYPGATTASTGNEKAIEIFNPTTTAVNLNPYSIRRYSNGLTTGANLYEERLMRTSGNNTLARGAVFVIANPEATLRDIIENRSQIGAPRSGTVGTTPNVLQSGGTIFFNGNDAMALVRYPSGTAGMPNVTSGIIVDIIGVIGQNPPNFSGTTTPDGNWRGVNPSDPIFPGTNFIPDVRSENQSLRRRPTVFIGVRSTVPTVYNANGQYLSGYNISTEWEAYSYAQAPGTTTATTPPGKDQSYAGLSGHNFTGTYGTYAATVTTGALEAFNAGISVYPNPASGGQATVEIRGVKVGRLTVLNGLGQRISVQPRGLATEKISLDVSGLRAGLYFVQCQSTDGQLTIYKELVVQ